MDGPEDEQSCYAILGVDPAATSSEIRQAYRKLALAKHPDRGGDPAEFARVTKAYEVLSDSKARAKYDATGRTSKLTAEEEFIEAFRSSTAANADAESRPAEPRCAAPEPESAPRRFAWERGNRSEQQNGQRRSGGVHSFSANVGSSRPSSTPDSAAGYIRPDNLAGAVQEAAGGLEVGARVRIVGLQKQQHLNSAMGVLVKFHGDRWQVRLEGDLGDKLFRAQNLMPASRNGPSAARAAGSSNGSNGFRPEPRAQEAAPGHANGVASTNGTHERNGTTGGPEKRGFMRPPADYLRADSSTIEICGSWNNWRPQPMILERQRRCHKFQVVLPSSAPESFQLFVAGDGPGRCLHPDRPEASVQEFHRLVGPDDNSQGHGWSIGKHPEDHAAMGARYEAMLIFAANGRPDRLDWVRLNPRSEAPKTTPAKAKARPAPYGGLSMGGFLQAAKPEWTQKDITSVLERLGKITVTDMSSLLRTLQSEGSAGVNQRFKAVGEKSFTDSTVRALREHAKKVAALEAERLNPKPKPKAAPPANPLAPLPTQEYKVVHDFVYLRQEPSLHAPILGKRQRGDTFHASEETWDGWVKLHGQPGYIIKDMGGLSGIGKVLSQLGRAVPLVLPEPQGSPEPLTFEVVYQPFVAVRTGPSKTRPIQGTRKFGERLRAESQGYGGWVRVVQEDGGGWMLTLDDELGQLLACKTVDERRKQVSALRHADHNNVAQLTEAIAGARRCGVRGIELEQAEADLRQLREREASRKELLQCAAAAQSDVREERLRRCVEEAERQNFVQEKKAMEEALDKMVSVKMETQREHDLLLEQLAEAAKGGQVADIKAARNAAKAAGVPMKEIARVFALHNGSGQ